MKPEELVAWSARIGPYDDRHYCGKDLTVAEVKRAVATMVAATRRYVAKLKQAAVATRGTVGGLLASAPVGSIVESGSDSVQYRSAEIDPGCRDTGNVIEVRTFAFGAWSTGTRGAYDISYSLHLPARLVPASEADASPESRGPLPKGG